METALFILIIVVTLGIFAVVAVKNIHNRRSVEGVIERKTYRPARTVTRTKNRHQSALDERRDRMPEMSIETRTIPESWKVTVRPDDGSSKVTREVSEQVWETLSEGDRWSDEDPPR